MTTTEHLSAIVAKCHALIADHEGCDGTAKLAVAGWRSTIAAIEGLQNIEQVMAGEAVSKAASAQLLNILAAWPLDLL